LNRLRGRALLGWLLVSIHPLTKFAEVVGIVAFGQRCDGGHHVVGNLVDDSVATVPHSFTIEVVSVRPGEIGQMFLGDAPPPDLRFPVFDFLEDTLRVVGVVLLDLF